MRLPDIDYNRAVRPLAKEDTSIAMKKAQIEIDLSNAKLGAELDAAGKVGAANIRLARSREEADKKQIAAQAQLSISTANLEINKNLKRDVLTANIASSLTQTAINTGVKWYAANEEAKVATSVTGYSSEMSKLTTDLQTSQTIDLNKYPGVDFSSIPESMIYEGVDAVTGEKVRSVPNHVGAPVVFASVEKTIRERAAEGLTSEISQAQFENGVSQRTAASLAMVTKSGAKYQKSFLAGEYEQARQSAVKQENHSMAFDIINSAEARGVISASEGSKQRGALQGEIRFSSLIRRIDNAATSGQLDAIKEEASGLDRSTMTTIRAAVARKQNVLDAAKAKAEVELERTQLANNTEIANDVGIAAGGTYENQRGAVVDWSKKHDPEHLSHYTASFKARFNQAKNAKNAELTTLTNETAEAIFNDPSTPIPGEITGQSYINLQKLAEQRRSGTPPKTNMKMWDSLQDMAVENPEKFKSLSLGSYMNSLDEATYKSVKNLQAKMKSGSFSPTQLEASSSQFDGYARQAFGSKWKTNSGDLDKALQMKQGYINAVEQLESTKGSKSTSGERQDLLNDLFKTQVTTMESGWLGGVRANTSTLQKSEAAPYVPQISAMLKQNSIPVTPGNIAKQYNLLLKLDKLKDLEF